MNIADRREIVNKVVNLTTSALAALEAQNLGEFNRLTIEATELLASLNDEPGQAADALRSKFEAISTLAIDARNVVEIDSKQLQRIVSDLGLAVDEVTEIVLAEPPEQPLP